MSKLRWWRIAKGLTLEDVSGLSGISVTMLSRVERGQRTLAPLDRVRLARCLGARVGDLFEVDESGADMSERQVLAAAR